MATLNFLTLISNVRTLVQAITSSAGAGDANKIVATGAAGRLDESLMPVGIGADTANIVASETLAAGDYVNVWNDAGTPKVRKASALDNTKPATGFILNGAALAATATVYFEGQNTAVTGLTAGVEYVLSKATPGGVTARSAFAGVSGNILQPLGTAVGATAISTEIAEAITFA